MSFFSSPMFRNTVRHMSGASRARHGFRRQMPLIKSMVLTVVFGSAVVETTKNRKELDGFRKTYEFRFSVLQEIIGRLERDEPVDIQQELKVVNTLTKHRYNTATDIELDEQLEHFLKQVESEIESEIEPEIDSGSGSGSGSEPGVGSETTKLRPAVGLTAIDSSKFL